MKGYKVFRPDWTCRGFQYSVGKTFEEDVTPSCCNRGFHFCTELKDCFNYYSFNPNKIIRLLKLKLLEKLTQKELGTSTVLTKSKLSVKFHGKKF